MFRVNLSPDNNKTTEEPHNGNDRTHCEVNMRR